MINLLPAENIEIVTREYRHRRLVVVGLATTAIILVAVILAVSLSLMNYVAPTKVEPMAPATPLDAALVKKINLLATWQASNVESISLFELINRFKPAGISLSGFAFTHSTGKPATIELSGVAAKRRDLLDFLDNLRGDKTFSNLESPVSNLIKDKNADFTIILTVAKKSEITAEAGSIKFKPGPSDIVKINDYFLNAATVPTLFESLEKLATSSAVILDLTQAAVTGAKLNFNFVATGDFSALQKFLSQVEALPYALSFTNLRISKVASSQSGQVSAWRANAVVELFSYEN